LVSEKNNRLIQIAEAYNEAVSEYRSGDMKNVREPVKGIYSGHWIDSELYHMEDGTGTSCYLLIGKEKALLIDTGMNAEEVMPYLRKITQLPVMLAVTHGHPDHMRHADEFQEVYIGQKDLEILPEIYFIPAQLWPLDMEQPPGNFQKQRFIPLKTGDIIEPGDLDLEVIELAGHTPGSVLYVEHKRKIIFSGDALGCGSSVGSWLFFKYCPVLSEYVKNTKVIYERLKQWEDYIYLSGHFFQMFTEAEPMQRMVPPGLVMLEDTITMCQKVLNCELGYEESMLPVKDVVRLHWRTATIEVIRSHIR